MRLIHVDTLQLREFYDETTLPQYAILSHTWSDDEIALQEFEQLVAGGSSAETTRAKNGYKKIVAACKAAKELQIYWCWVDTCCIDKKSSAELTEAINSMFKWYMHAAVCLAYLSDLDVMTESQYIRRELPKMMYCRWFTRGWCLQELIAPENLIFYDKEWNTVTTKAEISPYLSDITGIDQGVLQDPTKLPSIPVACRLSWASRRETTRVEDQAYCLLGIFNITMPMLYGEGPKSFLRLQEEILRQDGDLSLFAWLPDAGQHEIYMDIYHRSSFYFSYISPETAQLLEASPEEAFDVVGRRFLTRDLYDFRAHIKFIPDANHPELFCILLLKLEGQNPQPRLPSVHLLPPVVWSRDILGKSYNFAQLVEHSILLADRETAEHDGIQQLAVGRHVFSVHLITGEVRGEPAHEIIINCWETN
ncbi:Vegetative incompatibility protein HET-E-1 [Apiospora arundinis]|uniref:Vegetative incompatibility protein HET-E-1 n=1 Tax=Apiospora arundinis TaxID=335852 RepID=A0ABR2II02_9PEZI